MALYIRDVPIDDFLISSNSDKSLAEKQVLLDSNTRIVDGERKTKNVAPLNKETSDSAIYTKALYEALKISYENIENLKFDMPYMGIYKTSNESLGILPVSEAINKCAIIAENIKLLSSVIDRNSNDAVMNRTVTFDNYPSLICTSESYGIYRLGGDLEGQFVLEDNSKITYTENEEAKYHFTPVANLEENDAYLESVEISEYLNNKDNDTYKEISSQFFGHSSLSVVVVQPDERITELYALPLLEKEHLKTKTITTTEGEEVISDGEDHRSLARKLMLKIYDDRNKENENIVRSIHRPNEDKISKETIYPEFVSDSRSSEVIQKGLINE